MVNKTINTLEKVIKKNHILMIICIFLVMGLAVTLIQFLQEKTFEKFTTTTTDTSNIESAYKILQNATESLNPIEHGELHKNCVHIDNNGKLHTCGHVHNKTIQQQLQQV